MRADPNDDAPGDELIVVRVERTGGIAGMRRQWTAEPAPDEAPRWIALIEGCPWASVPEPTTALGADRYQWRIIARLADEQRRAELPDDRLQGPWRELVDQVRAFGRAVAGTSSESPPDSTAPDRTEDHADPSAIDQAVGSRADPRGGGLTR